MAEQRSYYNIQHHPPIRLKVKNKWIINKNELIKIDLIEFSPSSGGMKIDFVFLSIKTSIIFVIFFNH